MRPEPGSLASDELDALNNALAGDWSSEPVALTYGMAEHHIRSAQDHLAGMAILLATSSVEDAIMTTARGVVEASARAAWLLDAQIDVRQRVGRCMTERLAAIDQEDRLNRRIGRTTDAPDRRDAIERSARRHGFSIQTDRRRRSYVGSDEFPGPTRAIELLFASGGPDVGPMIYGDLSAVAHSELAAYIERLPLLLPGESLGTGMPVEIGVASALSAYERAVRTFLQSYGWSTAPWNVGVTRTYADLRPLLGARPSLSDIARVRPESPSTRQDG